MLLVHTNFGNCLALRINLRISLLHFLPKDVKFIQKFFFGISEKLTIAHTFNPVLRRRVIPLIYGFPEQEIPKDNTNLYWYHKIVIWSSKHLRKLLSSIFQLQNLFYLRSSVLRLKSNYTHFPTMPILIPNMNVRFNNIS